MIVEDLIPGKVYATNDDPDYTFLVFRTNKNYICILWSMDFLGSGYVKCAIMELSFGFELRESKILRPV